MGGVSAPDEASSHPTFADLPLRPELLAALTNLGYEEPTPIQREAIPPLVQGRDLLGQAATGTGKTAAFALPLLERLEPGERLAAPIGLVLVPTRELAMQVSEAIHKYGRDLRARVLPVYGGTPIVRQLKALERGMDIVVATPGRALDLIKRRALKLDGLEVVVLDEADEMLDMGFSEDIEAILAGVPETRQAVLFSATMPVRIDKMARRHLKDPVRIELTREQSGAGEVPLVRQTAYVVNRAHKPAALARVLDLEQPTAALVFCRTRDEVDQLTETLNGRGYRAEALHGGLSQEQRTRVVGRLKAGTSELLVATDVAARGLDIDQLTHVFNYDVPAAPEAYVHRIGRVGRAGREGVAITFAQPREHRMLKAIQRTTNQKIAMEAVPTVADLRARRVELTKASLREAILQDDLEPFRGVVDALSDEFDVVQVALAAVKLAHEANGTPDDEDMEIPRESFQSDRPGNRKDRGQHSSSDRGARGPRRERGDDARTHDADAAKVRLFISAGRESGVRPQDLVGAICGESSLSGRDIGTITVHGRFALVEVPEAAADEVVDALRGSTIKGRKANVRREIAR